jgi:hypothetical protein
VAADCGGSEGRNTIDVVASGDVVWLACPKGSSTRIFRGVSQTGGPCNPALPFAGVGITPSSGSGPAQSFTTHISHCEGASAFRISQLRVTKLVDAQEPALAPAFEDGMFHLESQSCAPGENAELVSQYGTLDCAASSVAENGNELAVTFALAFDTFSFAGERRLFVDAKGGNGDPEPRLGWTDVGSWTVDSASPSTGGSATGGAGGGGGGSAGRGGVEEDDGGCGCRLARRDASVWLTLAICGLALTFARRRSSRSRRERTSGSRAPRR